MLLSDFKTTASLDAHASETLDNENCPVLSPRSSGSLGLPRRGMRRGTGKTFVGKARPTGRTIHYAVPFIPAAKRTGYSGRFQ